jgi:hypothetical protein
MTRTTPLRSEADLRAERHARTFTASQLSPPDPRVARLAADGYVALQIASILRMPVADVRLMLAVKS